MWNAFKLKRLAERGVVAEDGGDNTVIGLVEPHEYEAGEQLRLRECFGRESVSVSGQRSLPDRQRGQRHPPW